MNAAVIHQFGDFGVLNYEDIDTPKPKPGHILVKVLAAGINRLDDYIREGSKKSLFGQGGEKKAA